MKKGFAATTVEDVAEAAGYTRGAFYSNFRSKQGLFLELLRRDHKRSQLRLRDIFQDSLLHEDMDARVLAYYCGLPKDNPCFLLWIEAGLLAARDGQFRVSFNTLLHEKIESLSSCIGDLSARGRIPMRLPVELLATGIIGLVDGIQLLHAADPQEVTQARMETVLALLLARSVFGTGADFVSEAINRGDSPLKPPHIAEAGAGT